MSPLLITSIHDVLKAAEEARAVQKDSPWWRGNSESAWKLVPQVQRDPQRQERERSLALVFKADLPLDTLPARRRRSSGLVVSHATLRPPDSTPRLDRVSILVAAYFAVEENTSRRVPVGSEPSRSTRLRSI